MDEMEDFEKEILGDAPTTRTELPVEEIEEADTREAWETMPLKELRKYYKTQMLERRARKAEYEKQVEKCKKIRLLMKAVK